MREHVAQVSERVEVAAAAVFDEGVDDGAALSGIGIADEEPIFLADGRGTDGIFHEVIVELHAAIRPDTLPTSATGPAHNQWPAPTSFAAGGFRCS